MSSRCYCPICGKEFDSMYRLKQHFRHVHKIKKCPICGREFKNLAVHAFQEHLRGCEQHTVLYWLTSNTYNNSERLKKARDRAEEVLAKHGWLR
ncbi:MAG: hypothetical protein J7J61_05490 [Candidatus Hydrothermae bacterium]|nr:hypothetical protein [Candidatus Hydrothermae bacterium]